MTPDTPEKVKKRKRDVELPRITYTAASRTFDRLFKEDSLDSMKDVVRKKLGLSASIPVYLSQIRDGKSVDLDDDDDFEAFHSSAFSSVSTKVQVVLGEGSSSIAGNQTEPISQSSRRKKRKKRNSNASAADSSSADPSDKDAHLSKIRRVAFAEQSSDPSTTPYKLTEKYAQKDSRTDVHDASPEAAQLTKKSIPHSGRVSDVTTIEGSEVILEKERRKKTKRDRLPTEDLTTSQIPKLAPLTRTTDATETTQDADAQRTTAEEPVKPAKKSTKRKRSESPSRATEQTNKEPPKLPVSTSNGGSQDSRAPKKPKKKSSNLLDETPAGLPVPEHPTTASPSPTTQPSSQPPTKQKSRKKEKAAVDSAEKSVDPRPSEESSHHKSDGTTGPKKSKKAMRKSEAQPPDQNLPSTTKAVSPSHQEHQAEESRLPEPARPKGKSKKIEDPPRQSSKESDPNVIVQESSAEKQSEKDTAPTTAPQDYPAPTKTPKKTTKKKVEHPKAIDLSQPAPDDAPREKIAAPQKADAIDVGVKEVTRAAVQAILARNSAQSKPTTQVTTTPTPPVTTAPEKLPPPSDIADPAPIQPTQVTEKSSQPKVTKDKEKRETAKCDVCGESPPHPRSKCPIIKAGIRSMRRRMVELQELTSRGDDHSEVIAELERLIEKKTRKPRISAVLKLDAPALDETNLPTANHANDTPLQSTSKQSSTQSLPPKLTTLLAPSSQLPASQPPAFQLPAPQLPSPQLPASQTPRRSPSLHPPPSAQPSKSAPSENTMRNPKKPSTTHSKALGLDDISQGTTFLGFGDVSRYSEKDLQELVRGPKVSLADVPSFDTSEDENEQEEEAALENDSVEELPRNLSQMGYPDSSDESDNEDDDESPRVSISPKLPLIQSSTVRLSSGPEAPSTADDTQRANRSFQEVEALGSSRELDRAGDIVVNSIVDADIALISPSKASQGRHNGGYVSSDTSASSKGPVTRPASPEISLVSTAIEKGQELDPIEPSENPQASQPELIVSDDGLTPFESTPKEKVAVRTRSQRNKAAAPMPTPAATQDGPSQELVNGANEPSKPTRKTRSLTKISELPIPPNPSVRIIRPPLASTTLIRTRRQTAQEESQEPEATEPSPAKGKNAPVVKTTAKPLSKAMAKPTTKPLVILPPRTVANRKVPSSAKSILANGIHAGKTRGNKAAVVSASPPEDTEPNTTTMENGENPVTSWVTLQEGQAPQGDAETPGMLDELLSSPTPASSLTKGQKADVNGLSPVPLFVHTDSQQSFPYSQYPDLSSKVRAASPNDSEDEEEVAATVVKPATKPTTKPAMFRSLTEIASQPLFKSRRQSSQFANRTEAPVTDYYGPSAGQEESDDSGSDSDSGAEGKKVASHIPASRRAGVAVSKRK